MAAEYASEDWYQKHQVWLSGQNGVRADLTDADLTDADLTDADLAGANLRRANLTDAVLRRANLTDAVLTYSDLRRANLRRANLTDADLTGADLRRANLTDADLTGADLRRANLTDADLDDMYKSIPVTIDEVRAAILGQPERLDMSSWHSDANWKNGVAKPVNECGTSHCLAGWAHHLAAIKRPELLDPKVNVELVGRLALGDEVAKRFYDNNETTLEWLEAGAK